MIQRRLYCTFKRIEYTGHVIFLVKKEKLLIVGFSEITGFVIPHSEEKSKHMPLPLQISWPFSGHGTPGQSD